MKFFNRKEKAPPDEKVPDIKTLLKLARQCIDEKNMREAHKCCKKILRRDGKNYMALVLLGKSLGSSEQAPLTYQKAITLKPDHLLAWKGLANYYEKQEDIPYKTKLLSIYDKILTLEITEDDAIKTLRKYGRLGGLLRDCGTIKTLFKYMSIQHKEELIEIAKEQIEHLLELHIPFGDEDMSNIIDILQNCITNDDPNINRSSLYQLGEMIFQKHGIQVSIDKLINLETFSNNIKLKEWVCEMLCKVFAQNNSFGDFPIDNYIGILTNAVEDGINGGTLLAIVYYRQGNFIEAYRKCASSIKRAHDINMAQALVLLNCSKTMKNWDLTENLSSSFMKKKSLSNPYFVLAVYNILISSYIEQNKFFKAVCILKKIPIDKMDSITLTELGNLYLEENVNNDEILYILDSTDYLDLFKAFSDLKKGKFSQAIAALRSYDKHPINNYYLARVYWRLNLYDKCLDSLQRAATLIPNHPKIYSWLGIYYYRRAKDIQESKNYFETSYSLCKTDVTVIKMLSLIYDKLGYINMEFELLETAFNTPQTKEFWICTRLGRLSYSKGIMADAEMYLQEAIKINPRDATAHEWIGDVFFSTKSYSKSLHAYQKVVELSQDSDVLINCFTRIGSIYSEQAFYDEAIHIFDNILEVDPDNRLALIGVTENRIKKAESNVKSYLFSAAREQMQHAINRINIAMSNGIKDLIYYNLIGDALFFITKLPREHNFIILQTSDGEIRKGRIAIFEMAIDSFSCLAKIRDSAALFKCALIYFEYYYLETKRFIFLQVSYNLGVLCVRSDDTAWDYWDLLGRICFCSKKYDTAHYCFLKAINLSNDCNAPKVWSNLGALYLQIDKTRLARYCFSVGRQALPSYPPEWIGDGLLAEIIRDDGNVGIFAPAPEVPVGEIDDAEYLEWIAVVCELCNQPNEPICDMPLESLYVVPNAVDIIEWYLYYEQDTAWKNCSFGHLKEDKGQFSLALRYYEKAHEIAEGDQKNEILLHKARVLSKMYRYSDAIDVYRSVNDMNLEETSAFAFALYKVENYQESYNMYCKSFNDHCENDEQRVDVLIALSNVAYKLNGLLKGAKILLKAVQIISGEDHGFDLSFLKSYAFSKVDVNLVAYVMSECLNIHINDAMWWYYMGLNYLRGSNKYAKLASICIQRAINLARDTEYAGEIGKMHACISIAEFYSGSRVEAMKYAEQALYDYPAQSELWAAVILCVYSHRNWPHKVPWIRETIFYLRENFTLSRSINEWLKSLEARLPVLSINDQNYM